MPNINDTKIIDAAARYRAGLELGLCVDDEAGAALGGDWREDTSPAALEFQERDDLAWAEVLLASAVMIDTPAGGVAGIAAKLDVLAELLPDCSFCGFPAELFDSALADAKRLAGPKMEISNLVLWPALRLLDGGRA